MIDIHSHIVWGVDDGAQTVDDSLAMLQAASESGTTEIVATPHSNEKYIYDSDLTEARIRDLAEKSGNKPKIHSSCEFHLSFDNIDRLLENPTAYTINHKQYMLVECPDFHIGNHTEAVFRRLADVGISPIVAHPERNPVLRQKPEKLEKWLEIGALLQITAMSITGGFGNAAKQSSIRLMERGLVHFVASDAHDVVNRSPRLDEAYRAVAARFDQDMAELLFTDNPRAVVEGLPLVGGKQVSFRSPTRWFQFWKSS